MRASGHEVLQRLRTAMGLLGVDALFIPTSDAHNSEYVGKSRQRRAFVTNFHGSAGNALVTTKDALLWTDGRYWLEASDTLYSEFRLMKQGEDETPTVEKWVQDQLGEAARVGVDPFVLTIGEWERLSKLMTLVPVNDVVEPLMVEDSKNPLWKDAEDPSTLQIYARPLKYAGKTCKEKLASAVQELKKQHSDVMVLSALDEVAWLTNLRGQDVPYNPVFYAYALLQVDEPKVHLFTELRKVSDDVRESCAEEILFFPYKDFPKAAEKAATGKRILVDELQTSKAIFDILNKAGTKVTRVLCGPVQSLKAVKNSVELQGFRDCHVRDGAALTQYLAWLHNEMVVKDERKLNEFDAATKLEELRSQNDLFVQLSFPSISSTGPNGAIIHYHPLADKKSIIRRDQLYLIDSGAQYWDGTTDTTRTVCFDPPREEEMEAYTLVLKGHIALNSIVFPRGTSGHRLDVLARQSLWKVGLNYPHGTGHGVGSFLNVHEGPQGVGINPVPTKANMEEGMTISNEPGYYKTGQYGIRIENVEEVVAKPLKYSKDGFLGLSALTVVPLCRELIDVGLLTAEEREWVDSYHRRVVASLLPLLEERGDDLAVFYLKHHSAPL